MWFKRLVRFIKAYFNGGEVVSRHTLELMNYEEECKDQAIECLKQRVNYFKKLVEFYKKTLEHATNVHEDFYDVPKEFMVTDEEEK